MYFFVVASGIFRSSLSFYSNAMKYFVILSNAFFSVALTVSTILVNLSLISLQRFSFFVRRVLASYYLVSLPVTLVSSASF